MVLHSDSIGNFVTLQTGVFLTEIPMEHFTKERRHELANLSIVNFDGGSFTWGQRSAVFSSYCFRTSKMWTRCLNFHWKNGSYILNLAGKNHSQKNFRRNSRKNSSCCLLLIKLLAECKFLEKLWPLLCEDHCQSSSKLRIRKKTTNSKLNQSWGCSKR